AGVLTGEAAVNLGANGQGMVAGDLVNTASRLQSVAVPGTVLVGESTFRAASGAIAFEEAGDQSLKGKQTPVPAWRAQAVVGKVVRRRAGIAERDDVATTTQKLDASLAEFLPDDEERRWVGPRMRALLGIEEAPSGTREELFAAWRTFFERISERATTLMVF